MTYASEVLADAPWGWWRLTENPGGTSLNLDSSGNNRTMSLSGTWTAAVPGPVNKAIRFGASAAQGSSDVALTRPTVGTWETWAYIPSNPAATLPLCVMTPLSGGNGMSPGLILNTTGTVSMSVYTGSTVNVTSGVLAAGWHHLVGTVGAAGQFLYVDGVQVASGATTAGLNIGDSVRVAIHYANLSTSTGAVTLAEPAFYTTQLSAPRVLAHYTAAMATYQGQVLVDVPWSYHRLAESSGTTWADATGAARDMSITGVASTARALAVNPILRTGGVAVLFDVDTINNYGKTSAVPVIGTDATLEAWVMVDGPPSIGPLTIIGEGTNLTGTGQTEWGLGLDATLHPYVYVYDGATRLLTSPDSLVLNTWNHVVAVSTATGTRLRVNKVTKGTMTQHLSLAGGGRTMWLHGSGFDHHVSKLTMAEPAIYTTALSDARIDAHYDVAMPPGLPPMVVALRGTATVPVFTGTLAGALKPLTVQITGTHVPPQFNATLAVGLPGLTAAFDGGYTPPPTSGRLQGALGPLTATLRGRAVPPPQTATLHAALPNTWGASLAGKSKQPTGQHRWTLHDPTTNETYVFPLNPNKMTTPHSPRNFNIIATAPSGALTGGSRQGMGRVVELARDPFEWSFSGRIKTEAHYDRLLAWSNKVHRIQLSDHFGRTWLVRVLDFNPNELTPTPRISWRYEYDFKVLNYGELP